MSINIGLGKTYFLQKLWPVKRSIFNVPYIFVLILLFFDKNEIKWNQTDRHTILHIGWDKRKQPWFLWFFLLFHHKNWLFGNFHNYIRNQRVKIRKYREFDGNRKVHLFGTTPLMGFGSFFVESLIFLEK